MPLLKVLSTALVAILVACSGADPEEIELGELQSEQAFVESFADWRFGVRVDAGQYGALEKRQCNDISTTQYCLVPSRTFAGSQNVHHIYREVVGGAQDPLLGILGSPEANRVLQWISDTEWASNTFWEPQWGIDHAFSPATTLTTFQARIGRGGNSLGVDYTKAGTYYRLEGSDCVQMWENPEQPGSWHQCRVIRAYIDDLKIVNGAVALSAAGHGTYQQMLDSLRWQITGQAFFSTQGIGSANTTNVNDPMRRVVVPRAPTTGWGLSQGQQCMLGTSFVDSPGLGQNIWFDAYSALSCP